MVAAMRSGVIAAMLGAARGAGPLTLLAMGDWGGTNMFLPTSRAQVSAAHGLSTVKEQLGAAAMLLLGDNFYEAGVRSSSSSRFKSTFEDVYSVDLFHDLPFHVIAGNHDHLGNVDAQIEYKDATGRWQFPSLYYTLSYDLVSTSGQHRAVDIIMIDTVNLVGLTDDSCLGCPLEGPADVSVAEGQWSWLEQQLQSSTADFLWVAGHYPIYSAGQDGTQAGLVERLLPLLKQYGAHYVSGHDHMLEHIVYDGVQMFVAGMGKECCYHDSNRHTVPDGAMQYMISGSGGEGEGVGPRPASRVEAGFASMHFDDAATITYYDQAGTVLYQAPSLPPRARKAAAGRGEALVV